MSSGTLFAVPFDLDRLEVTGQPMPALEGVKSDAGAGDAQFAVSTTGTLVYVPGKAQAPGRRSTGWIRREDNAAAGLAGELVRTPLRARWPPPRHEDYRPRLDIWVYEWARDTLTRATAGGGARAGVDTGWPPHRVRLEAARTNRRRTYIGSVPMGRATPAPHGEQEPAASASWHPSGKFLAFLELTPKDNDDLMILPMEGDDASGWKAGKAHGVPEQPVQGARADVLAGRAMARV